MCIRDRPDLEQYRCNRTVNEYFVRKIPDVEQHRCYGTVYGSIRPEQEVNAFIADLEQHPYHMRVNSFAKFDNPALKQRDGVPLLEPHSNFK